MLLNYIIDIGLFIALLLVHILTLLITVAIFTLAERKILASIQRRTGPHIVGYWGLLQAFADAFKLLGKEIIFPSKANKFLFIMAPIISLSLALIAWTFIPLSTTAVLLQSSYSALIILGLSSLNVYSVILAGWSSNSKYAFLGACRSAAQMVSYEIAITTCLLPVFLLSGSLDLIEIVYAQQKMWYILPLLPISIVYFISIVAETNRTPFDLPEAEAELVAGFNTEYSAITFSLFFLGEYTSILLMSSTFTIFFLGGWTQPFSSSFFEAPLFWFAIKTIFISFLFIFIRGNLPRYRYDQLMFIGWKIFLPLTLAIFFFIATIMYFWGNLPINTYFYSFNIS